MLFKLILLLLIAIANAAASVLPIHTPFGLGEYPTGLLGIMNGVGGLNLFVNMTAVGLVLSIVLIAESAIFLYAAWRFLLGLIPMFK